MRLKEYRNKRSFAVTSEPPGKAPGKLAEKRQAPKAALLYVIQKHRASHLHYDFRLEWKGVLLSWAVPKGPSLDSKVKRLAMQVEDHPVEYADFEGVIPEGEYGGGTVMVWDKGTWMPEQDDVDAAIGRGDLKFTLHGKKLKGSWVLVRTHGYGRASGRSWLLIKHRDQYVSTSDIAADKPRSAATNRLLADIAREAGGDVQKAGTGDPQRNADPIEEAAPIRTPNPAKKLNPAKNANPAKKTNAKKGPASSRTVSLPAVKQRRERAS